MAPLEAGHDRGVALDAAGAADAEPEPEAADAEPEPVAADAEPEPEAAPEAVPEAAPEAVPDEAIAVLDPAVLDATLLGGAGPVQPGNLLGTTAPQIALL